jgi:hypothetical protein
MQCCAAMDETFPWSFFSRGNSGASLACWPATCEWGAFQENWSFDHARVMVWLKHDACILCSEAWSYGQLMSKVLSLSRWISIESFWLSGSCWRSCRETWDQWGDALPCKLVVTLHSRLTWSLCYSYLATENVELEIAGSCLNRHSEGMQEKSHLNWSKQNILHTLLALSYVPNDSGIAVFHHFRTIRRVIPCASSTFLAYPLIWFAAWYRCLCTYENVNSWPDCQTPDDHKFRRNAGCTTSSVPTFYSKLVIDRLVSLHNFMSRWSHYRTLIWSKKSAKIVGTGIEWLGLVILQRAPKNVFIHSR